MAGAARASSLFVHNNDTELHQLIIDELVFPYVMGEFLPLFQPQLAGGLLFAFLKIDGGLRPFLCGSIWRRCAARLTSDCTRDAARTYFTTTYPNQVAYRIVPRDARSSLTCSMICPRTTKTLMMLSPSSTPTSRRLFRKCVVRSPLTRSRARLHNHTTMGGCSLVMTSPPLKNYVLSLDTSTPCTAPPPTTVIVITAGTPITSKAQLAVSRGMAWR
jgi:hypothetical protein